MYVKHYKVLEAYDPMSLASEVTEFLNAGWKISGSLVITALMEFAPGQELLYSQAMIKEI